MKKIFPQIFFATAVTAFASDALAADKTSAPDANCQILGNVLSVIQAKDFEYDQRHSSIKAIYEAAGAPVNDNGVADMVNLPEDLQKDMEDYIAEGCPEIGAPLPPRLEQ